MNDDLIMWTDAIPDGVWKVLAFLLVVGITLGGISQWLAFIFGGRPTEVQKQWRARLDDDDKSL